MIWNETIPDRLRGRLAGVEMISYTSAVPVGTAVVLAFIPSFWHYDARHKVQT